MAKIERLFGLVLYIHNDQQRQQGRLKGWELSDGDRVTFGDDWEGLVEALDYIKEEPAAIYASDLTLVYQFFKSIFDCREPFYIRSRNVLKFRIGKAEFRSVEMLGGCDSYKEFVEARLQAAAAGLPAAAGIVRAVLWELETNKKSLVSIPLTKTGYLRRMLRGRDYKERLNTLMADKRVVKFLYYAMRGGNVVCNHWRVGAIIKNVYSWDKKSAYLSKAYEEKFPMTPFKKCVEPWQGAAWVAKVRLTNIILKEYLNPAPYLIIGRGQKWVGQYTIDNRVVGASEAVIYITDVDYRIISKQYSFNIEFLECYQAEYDYLPVDVQDAVLDLFCQKEYHAQTKSRFAAYYKSLGNSFFGVSVQSPFTPTFTEYMPDPDTIAVKQEYVPEDEQIDFFLEKMATLPYQWGVWICAHMRFELQEQINALGSDFVYSDTDCIKFIGEHKINDSGQHFEYKYKDVQATMGGWREEPLAKRFKMLGAKKYCAEYDSGLDVVLAGCAKAKAITELKKKGGLEAFKPGLVLTGCGGYRRTYNDTCLGYQRVGTKLEYVPSNTYDELCDYTIGQGVTLQEMFSKQDFVLYSKL